MPQSQHVATNSHSFNQDLRVQYEHLLEKLRVCQTQSLSLQDKKQSALIHFKADHPSPGVKNGYRNGFHPANGKGESFIEELQTELDRVSGGLRSSSEKLWADAFSVAERLSSNNQEILRSMAEGHQALREIGERLVYLDGCVREDALMLARLAECWDNGSLPPGSRERSEDSGENFLDASQEDDVNAIYVECFSSKLQEATQAEQLLIALSDVFARLRDMEKGAACQAGSWVPPTIFVRDTTKFWLKAENVMRFKTQIVQHLPVLIFDRKGDTSGTILESLQNLKAQNLRDWTTVSSVYLDDTEMQNYMTRLRRDDKATAIRVRFYGQRKRSGDQQLFLERKTHREKWTGEESCKERCAIRQEHIEALLRNGRLPPNMAPHGRDGTFASEVVEQVHTTKQLPVLRTVCDRSAFQESSTNVLRISLDTHLHMIKEKPAMRPPGAWCRDESSKLEEDDVLHFPYAVVEIKLQLEGFPPWLQNMVDSGMLIHTPRFSKYLHGAAGLFPDQVERLPYWFLQNADGTMSPATWNEMAAEEATGAESEAAPWLFPKNNEQPLLGKVIGIFGRKLQSSPSLEARADQTVGDLQKTRAMQARIELQPRSSSSANFRPLSPLGQSPRQRKNDLSNGGVYPFAGENHKSDPERPVVGIPPMNEPIQTPIPRDIESGGSHRNEPTSSNESSQPKGALFRLMKTFKRSDESSEDRNPESGQKGVRGTAMVRSRVEPKTFFANERTFLQWLNISVLIMLTGLSLLGGTFSGVGTSGTECGPATPPPAGSPPSQGTTPHPSQFSCRGSKYAGLVISPIAVLFMVYALYMYQKRTIQIMHQRKAVRYDDQKGPVCLVILLVTALIVAMAFSANAAFNS